MSGAVEFFVRGLPAPQGSKRGFPVRRANGKLGVAITESAGERVKTWREDVRAAALEHHEGDPIMGPVAVSLVFWLPRPKGHYRTGRHQHLVRGSAPAYPAGKPDLDKLVRSTLDALTSAGVYGDDAQVISLDVAKRYAGEDDYPHPGALISVLSAI